MSDAVVEVIEAQPPDEHEQNVVRELKPGQVFFRVPAGPLEGLCAVVPGHTAQPHDVLDVGYVGGAFRAEKGDHDSLSDGAVKTLVQKQQHRSEEGNGFDEELPRLGVLEDPFQRVLDVYPLLCCGYRFRWSIFFKERNFPHAEVR